MPRVEGIDLVIDTTSADARQVAAQIHRTMDDQGLLTAAQD
jgi:hypothetical protein